MLLKKCFLILFLISIFTHADADIADQQIRDNLKRHSYLENSAMSSIATEISKLVIDNQLEKTWGDSLAKTFNGTIHGFSKMHVTPEDLKYIVPALAAIAVKNPKTDMWTELSRGDIHGFTAEQQEHILNAYTIISLFQKLNENGFLSRGTLDQETYDEIFTYQLTETLNESFRKFGNNSLREKVTRFVNHIFPFSKYIPAIPEPFPAHYQNVHAFHISFNPHATRFFAGHQPATEDVAMDPASQVRNFKLAWADYRKNTLGLPINRDPVVNGYRTIFLRQPRDSKEDAAYYSSRISAELWKVKGKGDCGFDAVRVSRETFIREALSRFDTDLDIKRALKNDFKGFLVEWRYQKDRQDRRFFSKKLTDLIEKKSISVLTDHGNDADSVDNMPDADTKEFITAYYLEKGDFANETAKVQNNGDGFITSSQAQDAGDHNAGAVWRPEAGALKALAKIRGVNLRLWKRVDDKSAPAKFKQKRELDSKRANGNITPTETQKLSDLTEELELSAYPWSFVEIDRNLPTLDILNGGNHYDVVLREGDIEGFPHAFYNEIKSSKTSHPEWLDAIDRTVADLLVQYPFVKQLIDPAPTT